MYDSILVPTDGSPAAETATSVALALAEQFDAELHAITVLDPEKLPDEVELDAVDGLRRQAETWVTDVAEQATEAGVAVTTAVVEAAGPVHREIVDYGTAHEVGLVVMGTQGRTGLRRLVLGSVTERTLRSSPIPVLTVHEGVDAEAPIEQVLVATDGSEAAARAVDHGVRLAAATGATIHAVNVVDVTGLSGAAGSPEVLDALEEVGQRAVADLADRAAEASVEAVETAVLRGTPTRAVLGYADDHGIDVIVMGTHGRRGLSRYLIGSVTEKTVRLAERPVLTVAPSDDG